MTEADLTHCPSCGILYVNHPGLIPTCRELLEARAEAERLREELESASILENALYLQCDHNLQRAEYAKAERDRYRNALIQAANDLEDAGKNNRAFIAREALKEVEK